VVALTQDLAGRRIHDIGSDPTAKVVIGELGHFHIFCKCEEIQKVLIA
jgi:hypothetical protein